MIEGLPFEIGQRIVATIIYTGEIVVGNIEKSDAIFITTGRGKVIPYLIITTSDKKKRVIFMDSITDMELR